jgi:hypothetical protein
MRTFQCGRISRSASSVREPRGEGRVCLDAMVETAKRQQDDIRLEEIRQRLTVDIRSNFTLQSLLRLSRDASSRAFLALRL